MTILLSPNEYEWLWDAARVMYPQAAFTTLTPYDYGTKDNTPLLYKIEILPEISNSEIIDGTDMGLFVEEYGDYQFDVSMGSIIIDDQAIDLSVQIVRLPVGYHRLQTDLAVQNLTWKRTDKPEWEHIPMEYLHGDASLAMHGFYGRFYKDNTLVLERIDLTLFSYFHIIPLERPYEVVWSALLEVPRAGDYEFHLEAVGQAEFRINNELVISGQNPNQFISRVLEDDQLHQLEMRFTDDQDTSRVYLRWRPPGSEAYVPIPPESLTPEVFSNY